MEGERPCRRRKIDSKSSENEEHEYEVFLSFCGEDTRKNFTDHLYSYLMDLRIRTFRDKEELRVGEKIGPKLMEAIKKARILIPIFSKGYASSKWCLMELIHMVKCVEDSNEKTMICPIFYDVTPSEVGNQTGSFQEAFDQHAKDFSKKTVDEWKEALGKVSEVKGWERGEIADGHEAELVKEVVTKVLVELKKKHVEVTEHLVGMDQHEAELMQLLDLDCNDVKIVGIVGMGGIGKSTIAKVVFNKLCDQFHQRCGFLEDVREKLKQSGGLDTLKNKLMSDMLKRPSDGMQMNQSTFKSTKALIVLDDVNDRSQLMKIIGKRGWFGPGSRIIVTTRNRETFSIKEEGENIYEPGVMNPENALRLFCKHAFTQDCPWKGYEDLSKEMVSKVAGLPLSLEVMGSTLSTKKREVWDDILKKLEQTMPDKIQERLQISYDMLDYKQKQIFLDIACHFIGSEKEKTLAASYMWEACRFFPVSGIEALVTFSLVKVGENGRFRMHDQLRDLGRDIVSKENPNNPGDCSRLWSQEDALKALTSKRGTERIETLTLGDNQEDCLSNEVFERLSELRYLDLYDASNLKGDFKGIFSNLRWFRWRLRSRITEITNSICLPKLVVLDLSGSDVSDCWEDYIQIKRATNLKVLDLSLCSELTKTPDLSAFSKLERLNLGNCFSLTEISPSIGHLQHLNYLNLNYCYHCCEEVLDSTSFASKWKLPEFIWNLKSLVELHMVSLQVTELSEAIGNLTNLTILDVGGTGIKKLPDALGKLEKLETLRVSECKSLEKFPEIIGDLRSLRTLIIGYSKIKRLHDVIGKLGKLEELCASGCEFEELPKTIGDLQNLRRLKISMSRVKRLPSAIGNLGKLEMLDASRCESLEELPETIGDLRSLRQLTIGNSKVKRLPSAIGNLGKLEMLDASRCKSLEELPENIGNLRSLRWLYIGNSKVKRLPSAIGNLGKLEMLDASWCKSLEELPENIGNLRSLRWLSIGSSKVKRLSSAIGNLGKLKELDVCGCELLEELPETIGDLRSLRQLIIYNSKVKRLPSAIGLLEKLEELDASHCTSLGELPENIGNLANLRILGIKRTGIKKLPNTIGNLGKLEQLDAFGCGSLEELPETIGNLRNLTFLRVNSTGIKNLPADLSCCSHLGVLDLGSCPDLRLSSSGLKLPPGLKEVEIPLTKASLDSVVRLIKLERLGFHQCDCTDSVEFPIDLDGLSKLNRLEFYGCGNFTSLPVKINNLPRLRFLSIGGGESDDFQRGWPVLDGCESLESLPELPNDLEEISIRNCPSLDSLPDLSTLKRLDVLTISKCEKLRKIKGLEALTSLESLELVDCPSLERLPHLSHLKSKLLKNCGPQDESQDEISEENGLELESDSDSDE